MKPVDIQRVLGARDDIGFAGTAAEWSGVGEDGRASARHQAGTVGSLLRGARDALVEARRSRRLRRERLLAIRELSRMPAPLLADLGVTRDRIPEVVDGLLARRAGEGFQA